MKWIVRYHKILNQLSCSTKLVRAIPALLLAMILSISIVACGGGSDDTVSTASSSSTAVQTTSDSNGSTASSQAAETPASDEPARETSVGTAEFFIPAGEFENTEIEVKAGDLVRITFQAVGRSQGYGDSSAFAATGGGAAGSEGSGANLGGGEVEGEITLVVLDSLSDTIYSGDAVAADTVDIDIEFSGIHIISFVNSHIYKANDVLMEWTINPTAQDTGLQD